METSYKKLLAEQEAKVKKYEQKMRDLIEAYKTLSKEKETLESTVKTLSLSSDRSVNRSDESNSETVVNQVATLSNAIASLTEEKRAMERKYLEDKRITRGEYEMNLAAVREEMSTQTGLVQQLKTQLAETSTNLHKYQQKLLTSNTEAETLKTQLSEMQAVIKQKQSLVKRLDDDTNYFRSMRNNLEQEITAMKNEHEARVSSLEESIADLSATIGIMEQQHQIDQDTIAKLGEKLHTSTTDCRDFIGRKEGQSDTPDILQFQDWDKSMVNNGNVDSIIDQMCQLRSQLHKLDPSLDIDATSIVVGKRDLSNNFECSSLDCQAKLNQLREELECSQLAMQECIKLNCAILPGSYQQQLIDRLTGELSVAKGKICELQDELSSLDVSSMRNVKSLKDSILKTEWQHKQDLVKLQQQHNQIVLDLQSELTKHRNRTISLLAEKDAEIRNLQRFSTAPTGDPESHSSSLVHTGNIDEDQAQESGDHEDDQLYSSRSINSCPLYQCCEMKARMDRELKSLRQQKRQLSAQIHKLQSDIEYIKADWKVEVDGLTERAQRAESLNKLSSGINMEYLRNVMFRFLTTSDPSCRHLMAKAIGRVLQFSPDELARMRLNRDSVK